MRRSLPLLLTGALLAAVPAVAQDAVPEQPSQADVQRGGMILRSFTTVLNDESVDEQLKSQLFACLYGNSLAEISAAAAKVMAANEQLEDDNPQHVYAAAAAACGLQPANEDEAAVPGR